MDTIISKQERIQNSLQSVIFKVNMNHNLYSNTYAFKTLYFYMYVCMSENTFGMLRYSQLRHRNTSKELTIYSHIYILLYDATDN